jgi:hypothetical protein
MFCNRNPYSTDNRDNCGVQSVISSHPSSTYPVGATNVTWTVTDIHGNTNSTSLNVVVTDIEKPTISGIPANISVNNDAGACSAVGVMIQPSATV